MIIERTIPDAKYNSGKKRFELRMPCGRLLFSKGPRTKRTRRVLRAFNVPTHLGRCWKCAVMTDNPCVVMAAQFKTLIDTKSGLVMGFVEGIHEVPA